MTTQRPFEGFGVIEETGTDESPLDGIGIVNEAAAAAETLPLLTLTLTALVPTVLILSALIDVPLGNIELTALVPRVVATQPPATIPGAADAARGGCRSQLLLTEALPLRLSTQLGAFEEEQPLAHRYGDLRKSRFKLLKLSSTKWFAADHPMTITRVFVNDLETHSFDFKVESDDDGHTWTVVNLAAAAPLNATVTASGVGKLHPATGALIENPGDLAADVMRIAGRFDPWWGKIRSECSLASIALAGSINETKSLQAHLDVVIDSAAGMWCYGMARLYPLPIAADTFVLPLAKTAVHDLKVSASLIDTADSLRLSYAYDDADGRAQSYIELAARPKRFSGIAADLTLPMLRSAQSAEAIGRRILGRKAGERYNVSFGTDEGEFIRPGTWVLIQDHPEWPFAANPYVMITSAQIDRATRFVQVQGETVLSTPTIDVVAHSLGVPGIGKGGVEIAFSNGVLTVTVFDEDDKPFPGAYVSLDGSVPNKTDTAGKVTFITKSGSHKLAISKEGYTSVEQGFEL